MEFSEFVTLVEEMRTAQMCYFGARMGGSKSEARGHLERAKQLERKVDAEIRLIKMGPPKEAQTQLPLPDFFSNEWEGGSK